MLDELSDRFVNWTHTLLIPFVWFIGISALFVFLFGELPHLIDFLPIPQPIPFLAGVVGAIISIPIFFSLISSVLYGKINPFDENVRYDQTLKAFVLFNLLGSLLVFIFSLPILLLFLSWSWFFQIFFALGIASIFYMFMDSAVIELLESNRGFSIPNTPSVREIKKRGAVGEVRVRNWSENEKKFGKSKAKNNQNNSSENNSNSKTQKEIKQLEPQKTDFTPVSDFNMKPHTPGIWEDKELDEIFINRAKNQSNSTQVKQQEINLDSSLKAGSKKVTKEENTSPDKFTDTFAEAEAQKNKGNDDLIEKVNEIFSQAEQLENKNTKEENIKKQKEQEMPKGAKEFWLEDIDWDNFR